MKRVIKVKINAISIYKNLCKRMTLSILSSKYFIFPSKIVDSRSPLSLLCSQLEVIFLYFELFCCQPVLCLTVWPRAQVNNFCSPRAHCPPPGPARTAGVATRSARRSASPCLRRSARPSTARSAAPSRTTSARQSTRTRQAFRVEQR